MRVGSIGYGTQQGLGILLKDFYDHGVVTDVIQVKHWKYINHDWYNSKLTVDVRGGNYNNAILRFLESVDVMFLFETPFVPHLMRFCKDLQVPTVLMPMYECTPRNIEPDHIINPSLLDQEHYPTGTFIPVPVPDHISWKKRETAKTFIHNAGHLGLHGRNGTKELVEAIKYVKSPIRLIIRSQEPIGLLREDPRIELRIGTVPKEELYEEGDVFIFPEKFNGLSLPLQEAFASGMMIMASDRFPMNTWLPKAPLIPIKDYETIEIARSVTAAIVNPKDIARKIDTWYGHDISTYSEGCKVYEQAMSWEELKPKYMEHLESVCYKKAH